MPLLFDEIDRVELPNDEWVDICRRMNYRQQQALVAQYMRLPSTLASSATPDIQIDIETGSLTLLLLNIVRWNLIDKNGTTAPINKETIGRLDPRTAQLIINAITERNPAPKV